MPDVEPLDVVRFTAKMTLGTESVANVYHFQHEGATPVDDGVVHGALATLIQLAYDGIEPVLTNDLAQDTIESYNMTQDRPMVTGPWPGSFVGDATSDTLPYQNAAVLTFPTAVKKSLGKKFIPGLVETNSIGDGLMSAAMLAELAVFVADILAGTTAGGQTFSPGNYRTVSGVFIKWVSGIVETLIGSQRRRKPGVGA